MDQEISLSFYIRLIRKYWLGIVLWMAVGTLIAGGISYFAITPKYKASVQILVSRHSDSAAAQFAAQQADVQMITTYKELITNQVILKPAQQALASRMDYHGTLGTLKKEVSVSNTQNSQVFSIDVVDSKANQSVAIANQIAETFKDKIRKIIKVNNVTIVSEAVTASNTVSPRKPIYVLMGVLGGLMLGLFYASMRIFTDQRVHGSDFLTDELALTNLGQVNHQQRQHVSKQINHLKSKKMTGNQHYIQKRV